MNFELRKQQTMDKLYKPDKSKKGDVDKPAIQLIEAINKLDNYYTTSSCSGRIAIFTNHGSTKKWDSEWLFVTHEKTRVEPILAVLEHLPESDVWMRMEGFILHVDCKTVDDAKVLVGIGQQNGLRRTGIISIGKRNVVQFLGTEKIDALIASQGKLLVNKEYIQRLLDIANTRLDATHKKIDLLLGLITQLSKP